MFTGTVRKIAAAAIVGACALGAGACDSSYSRALWLDGICQEFRFEMGDPGRSPAANCAAKQLELKVRYTVAFLPPMVACPVAQT